MTERASDAPGTQPAKVRPMRESLYWKMAATILVAAFAAVISYNHIYDLGLRYGGDSITAHLLPLVVDGTVAAVSRQMFLDYSGGEHPHWLTWVGLAAGVGATVAANVDFGIKWGWQGAVIWALPPAMFVIAAEITLIGFKRDAERTQAHRDAPALEVVPDVVPSIRQIMRDEKVGRPKAKMIRAQMLGEAAA